MKSCKASKSTAGETIIAFTRGPSLSVPGQSVQGPHSGGPAGGPAARSAAGKPTATISSDGTFRGFSVAEIQPHKVGPPSTGDALRGPVEAGRRRL